MHITWVSVMIERIIMVFEATVHMMNDNKISSLIFIQLLENGIGIYCGTCINILHSDVTSDHFRLGFSNRDVPNIIYGANHLEKSLMKSSTRKSSFFQ